MNKLFTWTTKGMSQTDVYDKEVSSLKRQVQNQKQTVDAIVRRSVKQIKFDDRDSVIAQIMQRFKALAEGPSIYPSPEWSDADIQLAVEGKTSSSLGPNTPFPQLWRSLGVTWSRWLTWSGARRRRR